MASSPTPTGQPSATQPFRFPFTLQQLVYGLFVLTGLCAAIPITLLVRAGSFQAALSPVFLWGCSLVFWAIVASVTATTLMGWNKPREEGGLTDDEKIRLLLLALGGAMGLMTAINGAVMPFTIFHEELKGGLEKWREKPRGLIWSSLSLFGGLGLMFASLQLGRGMERTNQAMRRLIYGYNAVLTGLLLLAVLALPNVLSYAEPFSRFMGTPDDWTKAQVYTLQPSTRAYLSELQTPVRFYVLLASQDPRMSEMRLLLENFRSVTNKVSREMIPAEFTPEGIDARVIELQRAYRLSEPYGVLVVIGDDPKTAKYDFIKADDLTNGRPPTGDYTFTGEQALMNSLKFLAEGQAVIYFTQGSGEPSLGGMPRMPGKAPPGPALNALKQRLTGRKGIEVKELNTGANFKRVPDDASAVVVVGPTREMPKEAVKALENYVNRKENEKKGIKPGKLLLLLDPVAQEEGGRAVFTKTGLEGLLAKNNVRLGNDIICDSDGRARSPIVVEAITNPASTNPIARAFNNPDNREVPRTLFRFLRARTVSPAQGGPPGGGAVAEKLLVTPRNGYWAEGDPNVELGEKLSRVRRLKLGDEKDVQEWERLCGEPLSLGVTVTGGAAPGVPGDMAHARLQKPRLVVIGNALWVSDQSLQLFPRNFDLFDNCLSWLRERPTVGLTGPPPGGPRKPYELGISRDSQTRVTWLPLALMALGVVGLGCGVWVVRRR